MQVQYVGRERYPNFQGLFTTKVINSHMKLNVKSDAQKVNWDNRSNWGERENQDNQEHRTN